MNTVLKHRWLVVDDDPSMLELTAAVLRSVPGSEVVACGDPRIALGVFSAEPESFELMVTDFNMPGLDGLELARAVHERAPALKVVMVTGGDLEGACGGRGELQALLPKPCAPNGLIAAVRAVLAATRWDASRCGAGSSAPVAARPEPAAPICLV